ncbi:6-phosphofructokinase [Reinekea sp. MED297]|uniref:6-phosphofructokinase n=1 Tax=Reinekea blandensis MED297 TaxID=314283 RepID=A4BFV4_9GAMM|nr:6-phosphofructokinase [Reinekea sp. MED297] [Reinekea blandensis MED297]
MNTSIPNTLQDFQFQIIDPAQESQTMYDVQRLAAANLAAEGDVSPQRAMEVARDPNFDDSHQTRTVLIRHKSGHLAGSFSVTRDGDEGMPVLRHFERDLVFLRRKHRLANGWRFMMSPRYQSALLRRTSTNLFLHMVQQLDADAFVLYFNDRLVNYYRRMFSGRVMASTVITLDGQIEVPVSLMVCETAQNRPVMDYLPEAEAV